MHEYSAKTTSIEREKFDAAKFLLKKERLTKSEMIL